MAELTNQTCVDVILDKKLDRCGPFDEGNIANFRAEGELTITITLGEYRSLVSRYATSDMLVKQAESDKYERMRKAETLEKANADLKAENYDLKTELDELKKEHQKFVDALRDMNEVAEKHQKEADDLRKRLRASEETNKYLQRNIADITEAKEEEHGCD